MSTSKQLLDEIGERISKDKNKKIGFSLLYQTTDKADVEEFHMKCDAKGPTVTILYGKFNTLFGGYTSKSWRSTDKQKVKDENAFLFKKDDSLDAKCVFLPIRKDQTEKAIVCDKHFGPTFGSGMLSRYDLQTFRKDSKPESKKKGDFLKLNGSLNVKFSYSVVKQKTDDEVCDGVTELKASDINSGRMVVRKLEVYQVTDDEFEKDWLERIEGDAFRKKKRELMQMKPLPGLDIDQYNVLLLGAVGAGKSSFINTLSALVTGKIEPIAPSRQSASSVTNMVKKYDLISADGDTLKIRFYDIRGFESGRENAKELELLIDGRLPENYQFPEKFNPDDVIEERPNPTLNEQIHLICFVEENSDFDKYTVAHKEQINGINRIICNKGLPMVVIATKFDKLCPKISENVAHLFKSPKAKNAVDAIAKFHGVNKNQVLPVVNYTDEEEGLDAKDQLALKALNRIYQLIEGYLKHHPDIKFVPDGWKDREDALPVWKDDVEKRNLLSEIMTPFDDKNLRILLVGPVDSGKSSFIDSVQSALRNKITADASIRFARTTPENLSSTTEKFKLFPVDYVDKDTGLLRRSGIRLGDTPGFQEQDGIKEDHVKFIISGNVPDGYKIINGIQDTQDDFQRNPLPGDKIHCVCFVFDCEKVQEGFSESLKTSMKRLQQMIVEQAVFMEMIKLGKRRLEKLEESARFQMQRVSSDTAGDAAETLTYQRRSLRISYKAEDATGIYKPRDNDEELDLFLCSGKVKNIKTLIESGRLPRQRILDEMCQIFGRESKTIRVTCEAICEHIKSKHVAIVYVWAAYTIQNPQRITFVITVKHKSEDDKSTKPVRLDKLIAYSFVKQYAGDFSLEGLEVIKQHTSASELDEESYQNLQSCISKHSEDLMKRHKYLSIISACSNRSKGFGASWTLLPEKCIVLYVQKKNYIPIDEEPFEKYYGEIAVDVREGAFYPFGRTAREKLDPVKMGCQIRGDLYNGQYVEGTLGCFVDHPQFGVCGLTCAHVLLSPWELVRLKTTYSGSLKWPLHDMYKNIYQPADQNSSIGHTVQFIYDEGSSTKSGIELAVFKITDRQPKSAIFPDTTIISASSVNNIKYDNWRICSTDRLNKKENLVIKFGSKTEFRHGTIMFDNTAVKNLDSYPLASGYAVIKLFKQIEVKTHTHDLAFADRGDSGALVFLAENNSQYSCLGIVEGGTTYGTVVVTPIVPILEELKVHCLKSFESEINLSHIGNQIQSIHGDMQNIKRDLQSVRQDIRNIDNTLQIIAQSLPNNQQ